MYFGEKIRFVYENYEVLRYKVGMMEDYLGIQRVHASSTREEKKKGRRKCCEGYIPHKFCDDLATVSYLLAKSSQFCSKFARDIFNRNVPR